MDLLVIDGLSLPVPVPGAANPVCFVMKQEEVKQLAHRGEKEGRVSYWLQPNQYDTDHFREAWDRIGRGDRVC
jgi:hypothetical protein